MKKVLKVIFVLAAASVMLLGSLTSVFADESVGQCKFLGNAERYFFDPVTEEPLTTVFDYTKAEPGEPLVGELRLKNHKGYGLTAKLTMTVICDTEEASDLMGDMKVSFKQKKVTSLLATPIVKSGKIFDEIDLGTLYIDADTTLVFNLQMPDTLPKDKLVEALSGMRWQFSATEIAQIENNSEMRSKMLVSNETWMKILIISLVVLVCSELIKAKFRRSRI